MFVHVTKPYKNTKFLITKFQITNFLTYQVPNDTKSQMLQNTKFLIKNAKFLSWNAFYLAIVKMPKYER